MAVSLPSGPRALEDTRTMSLLVVSPAAVRKLLTVLSPWTSARRRLLKRMAASLRLRGEFPLVVSTPSVRPMEAAKDR